MTVAGRRPQIDTVALQYASRHRATRSSYQPWNDTCGRSDALKCCVVLKEVNLSERAKAIFG